VLHSRPVNRFLFVLVTLAILGSACNMPTPTTTTATTISPATNPPPIPSLTPTLAPQVTTVTPTVQPTGTSPSPNPTSTGAPPNPTYLDDRSTPTGLILSYVNAINLKQYLRAYSYWRSGSLTQTFDQFQQGYQNTASVLVTLGTISGDAGAGQMYYTVPAVLVAQTTAGEIQTFSACYTLHLSNPGIQTEPPFIPMGINSGAAKPAANGSIPANLLAHACDGFPQGTPINPAPVTHPGDITPANFLDDRSTPQEVLSSYFNAVNRKEYARAYSYWEDAGTSQNVPPFSQFQQGYANTASVQITTGQARSDAGAGQLYYTLPAVLKSKNADGSAQTFSACYTFHISQPAIQATQPFRPLAIRSATAKSVPNNSDTSALLGQACVGQP